MSKKYVLNLTNEVSFLVQPESFHKLHHKSWFMFKISVTYNSIEFDVTHCVK